jgi:hypothetical protein
LADEQQQLDLGRGFNPPVTGISTPGFHFSACYTFYTRMALWAHEYKLRLILPERQGYSHENPGPPSFEHRPDGSVVRERPLWQCRAPEVATDRDRWRAGSRGNSRQQVMLEIANTPFFPDERDEMFRWVREGCVLVEEDPLYHDILNDIEMWFVDQIIHKRQTVAALEPVLLRVPLPTHKGHTEAELRGNLLDNLHNCCSP